MNKKLLQLVIPQWQKAHQLRDQAVTGKDAGQAARRIAALHPLMCEAYARPEDESSATPLEQAVERETRARGFEYGCRPATDATRQLCEEIIQQWITLYTPSWTLQPWKKPLGQDLDDRKFILSTIIANTFNAVLTGRNEEGVYITRSKEILSTQSRYRPHVFNIRLIDMLSALVLLGVIRQVIGQKRKDASAKTSTGERYKRTTIHATNRTLDRMCQYGIDDVRATYIERAGQEVVLLEDEFSKKKLEYLPSDITANQYRAEIVKINDMLRCANIAVLNGPGLAFADERDRFNERLFFKDWTTYGRLHGGFWADGRMRKTERRQRIRMNEEETVELDFHAVALHLLYAQVGAALPTGDLYNITGVDLDSRAGLKVLMATLHNDPDLNRQKFPRKSAMLFTPHDRGMHAPYIIQKICEHHRPIKHLLGTGQGLSLMFRESQLLVSVLLRMIEEDYIGLPLHDGLMVPRSQAEGVKQIMEEQALLVTGIAIRVTQK